MTLRTALFAVLVACATTVVAEVPPWIANDDGGPPIWMSADEARNADGTLRWEFFPQSMREELELEIDIIKRRREERRAARKGAQSGCETYTIGVGSASLPDTELQTFLDRSELAIVGHVIAETEGFYYGKPATLFEIAVDDVLTKPSDLPSPARIFMPFSHAEIASEGVVLCTRNDHFPHRPTKGRRVLVFAQTIQHRTPLIAGTLPSWLMFERADGGLSITWVDSEFTGQKPEWSLIEKQLSRLNRSGESATEAEKGDGS